MKSSNKNIKQKQRESLILREISPLLMELFKDYPELANFLVTKVELSKDGGLCSIFVYDCVTPNNQKGFSSIKLFAPSTRKALAQVLQARYVPELRFIYDASINKILDLNQALCKISQELKDNDEGSCDNDSEESSE